MKIHWETIEIVIKKLEIIYDVKPVISGVFCRGRYEVLALSPGGISDICDINTFHHGFLSQQNLML